MNRQLLKRQTILGGVFRITDAATIIASAAIAHLIKFNDLAIPDRYYLFTVILILLTINLFSALNLYKEWQGRSLFSELTHLTAYWLIALLFISTLTFVTRTGPEFSREWAAWTFTFTYIGFINSRIIFRYIIRNLQKSGYNQKQVIIIGAGQLGLRACHAMQKQSWSGLIPIAFFDDARHGLTFNGVKVEGTVQEAVQYIEKKRRIKPVDQVWIALPLSAQKEIEQLQNALQDTATKVYFIPDLFGFNLASYSVDEMVGLPVMNMSAPPMNGWSATLKRSEDIIISSLALLVLSPLLLLIAILIKRDSKGPVFFKQRRYGQDGKEILVWKFRSMTTADNGTNVKQASRNDVRITKIGAFLRKSSIDELPQLINVLFGTMSLVGPRPHAVAHNEFYRTKVQGYMVRHQMRPGITGWAQVNGSRGETAEIEDMRERIRYDLEYIRNWSIFLDIRIILMTFKTVLNTKDTY